MSFDYPLRPLLWQRATWSALTGRVLQSRLAHALLFSGHQGLGKKHLARAFTQYLLCESPQPEGACGQCRGCHLFETGNHPDFLLIEPEEEGKDLTIGQIRGVAGYQALTPQYSTHKVVLLSPAERMNQAAANALLKTLEEPTPGTLLLLVTDRPTALLPTIRSRCQSIAFTPPAADTELIDWIVQRAPLTRDSIGALLALTSNAPLRVLQLAEEGAGGREAIWNSLARTAGGETTPSEAAAQWQELGMEQAFGWTHAALCELIRSRVTEESVNLGSAQLSARLQALAKPIDLKALFKLLDRAQEAGRLIRAHANAQLLAEEFLIHWTTLFARRQTAR